MRLLLPCGLRLPEIINYRASFHLSVREYSSQHRNYTKPALTMAPCDPWAGTCNRWGTGRSFSEQLQNLTRPSSGRHDPNHRSWNSTKTCRRHPRTQGSSGTSTWIRCNPLGLRPYQRALQPSAVHRQRFAKQPCKLHHQMPYFSEPEIRNSWRIWTCCKQAELCKCLWSAECPKHKSHCLSKRTRTFSRQTHVRPEPDLCNKWHTRWSSETRESQASPMFSQPSSGQLRPDGDP